MIWLNQGQNVDILAIEYLLRGWRVENLGFPPDVQEVGGQSTMPTYLHSQFTVQMHLSVMLGQCLLWLCARACVGDCEQSSLRN